MADKVETKKMLYVGKTTKDYTSGSMIDVELVAVKNDEGKVVDHVLPQSLVGRVREAGSATSEKNPLEDENTELKKENAEIRRAHV
ncbi:MAG TPA: hypothetical protein DDW91_15165, partial [Shewanella frigidimarina]|nr:hypothetical protein [Shewanella frigidimarina]